jgi:hypothetical protein
MMINHGIWAVFPSFSQQFSGTKTIQNPFIVDSLWDDDPDLFGFQGMSLSNWRCAIVVLGFGSNMGPVQGEGNVPPSTLRKGV